MIKVGITGGIGAGKTIVCRIFETLGIPVFNADSESKEILFTDPQVIGEMREVLGEEVFDNGVPVRKKIAEIIFNDTGKLSHVNSILHSAVLRRFGEWCTEKKDTSYILAEAALIFETGMENILDKVIVVTAPGDLRIKRTRMRDHLSDDEVKARMKNQFSQEAIELKSDFKIINDETRLLIPQVMEIHQKLSELSALKGY